MVNPNQSNNNNVNEYNRTIAIINQLTLNRHQIFNMMNRYIRNINFINRQREYNTPIHEQNNTLHELNNLLNQLNNELTDINILIDESYRIIDSISENDPNNIIGGLLHNTLRNLFNNLIENQEILE